MKDRVARRMWSVAELPDVSGGPGTAAGGRPDCMPTADAAVDDDTGATGAPGGGTCVKDWPTNNPSTGVIYFNRHSCYGRTNRLICLRHKSNYTPLHSTPICGWFVHTRRTWWAQSPVFFGTREYAFAFSTANNACGQLRIRSGPHMLL